MLSTDSLSDFELGKKAAYYDAESELVADEANKGKLKKPIALKGAKDYSSKEQTN